MVVETYPNLCLQSQVEQSIVFFNNSIHFLCVLYFLQKKQCGVNLSWAQTHIRIQGGGAGAYAAMLISIMHMHMLLLDGVSQLSIEH